VLRDCEFDDSLSSAFFSTDTVEAVLDDCVDSDDIMEWDGASVQYCSVVMVVVNQRSIVLNVRSNCI